MPDTTLGELPAATRATVRLGNATDLEVIVVAEMPAAVAYAVYGQNYTDPELRDLRPVLRTDTGLVIGLHPDTRVIEVHS